MKPIQLLILASVLVTSSCNKEESIVHPDLQPYFLEFQNEAAARGITVDFEKRPVGGEFISGQNRSDIGWCATENNIEHIVRINVLFWPALTELNKEKLVFHELGHCFLNRSHVDKVGRNGFCRSIMHSGQACGDNYSSDTRENYLNELFRP